MLHAFDVMSGMFCLFAVDDCMQRVRGQWQQCVWQIYGFSSHNPSQRNVTVDYVHYVDFGLETDVSVL